MNSKRYSKGGVTCRRQGEPVTSPLPDGTAIRSQDGSPQVYRGTASIIPGSRIFASLLCILLALALLLVPRPLPARQQPALPPDGASRPPALATVGPTDPANPTARTNPYVPQVPARAIAYQRAGYTLGWFGLCWHILGLWLLLRTRLSARLRSMVYRAVRRPEPVPDKMPLFAALALYYAAYAFLFLCWSLPQGLLAMSLEQRYGFSRQTVPGYLRDALTGLLFTMTLIPVIWCGFRLYIATPRRWWAWLWALVAGLLFVQMVLQPLVVAPAYNRFTPLPSGPLRDRIVALEARAGIRNARILIADTSRRTTHVNAYVTGWGPSTCIVIEDNALRLLPPDQIVAMLGHEMGHYVEGHLWILFVGNTLGAGLLLWLLAQLLPRLMRRHGPRYGLIGLTDPAALPLISLTLYVLLQLQMPLANLESRVLEHRADAYGLRLTHLNDATARLFVGFAERDFSDPDPPALLQWWYGSHPTLKSRIAFALKDR